VGYSVITGSQRYYLQLNRRIRQEVDVFSVFGGPHPTFFPEMLEEEGVDGICIGEGEGAMVDLANALDNGGSGGLQNPVIPNWHVKLDPIRGPYWVSSPASMAGWWAPLTTLARWPGTLRYSTLAQSTGAKRI
jgi:hypothetical protein